MSKDKPTAPAKPVGYVEKGYQPSTGYKPNPGGGTKPTAKPPNQGTGGKK